jgi:monovalent cation:proton antiporter-2 (CPA2) family protein
MKTVQKFAIGFLCLSFTGVFARTSFSHRRPLTLSHLHDESTSSKSSVLTQNAVFGIPRGGGYLSMVTEATTGLSSFLKGSKTDALILLATTALNTPICNKLQISPILGFLSLGLLLGPNGKRIISDVHKTEMLADLGIVMFLFEMGIHLDFSTLMSMKRDVFGIGLSQFTMTAVVVAGICKLLGFSLAAMVIIGWSLALSSSAFVLQLLKDKGETESQYGKASFGTLLLQDLMVVPLLVITPILAGTGGSAKEAVTKALVQIAMALTGILTFGKFALNPLLDLVAASRSQEASIGMILTIVIGMSFLTEGLGLSNTLGAFLSGMLIAETKHRHKVEVEASPIRGILVGLFFFTVGFEVDLGMIKSRPREIAAVVTGILALKTVIATAVCRMFGLPMSIAQRVGLVLSQGGEFGFLAFKSARKSGILSDEKTKLLLTAVSLTMALTPILEQIGSKMASKLEVNEMANKKKMLKEMGQLKMNQVGKGIAAKIEARIKKAI